MSTPMKTAMILALALSHTLQVKASSVAERQRQAEPSKLEQNRTRLRPAKKGRRGNVERLTKREIRHIQPPELQLLGARKTSPGHVVCDASRGRDGRLSGVDKEVDWKFRIVFCSLVS